MIGGFSSVDLVWLATSTVRLQVSFTANVRLRFPITALQNDKWKVEQLMHQSFLKKIVMVMIKFKITSVYIKVIFVRIINWEKLDYSLPSRTMGKGGKGGIKKWPLLQQVNNCIWNKFVRLTPVKIQCNWISEWMCFSAL